jgi:hypothetical protein
MLLEGGEVHLAHRSHPFTELLGPGFERGKLRGGGLFPFDGLLLRKPGQVDFVPLEEQGVQRRDVHLESLEPQPFRGLLLPEFRFPAPRLTKGRFDLRKTGNDVRVPGDPLLDPLLKAREGHAPLLDRVAARPHRLVEGDQLALLVGLPAAALGQEAALPFRLLR